MLYTCIGGFSSSSSRYYFHLIRSELDGFIKEHAIRVIARCALSIQAYWLSPLVSLMEGAASASSFSIVYPLDRSVQNFSPFVLKKISCHLAETS